MLFEISSLLNNYGYVSLFITSFLASTILPLGSEGILIFLILNKFDMISVVFVASIGNYLGACTSYYIGLKGRHFIIKKYFKINNDQICKSEKLFSKYGSYILLFTWLPLIGDALTVTSGILKYRFTWFTLFVFTGKFLRYFIIAYLVFNY
ncbi:MAG: DedA family protein [Methanococcoides sp.]|nr:DedA family protein [Methanococcoides sp.]